jgi:hypothetical protein
MKPQSAKAKGRKLQQYIRDEILIYFPELTDDDVRSTSMGSGGEDVQLSTKARTLFPFSVEAKSYARISCFRYYEQACANAKKGEPIVVMKENGSKPLVLLDFKTFMELVK